MISSGIVIETGRRRSFVLNDEGVYDRVVTKKGLKKGDRIIYTIEDIYIGRSARDSNWARWLACAAVLLILFGSAILPGIISDFRVYAVVSIDINPSIQYYLDDEGRVLRAEGMNDDGKKLIRQGMDGMSIDEAINLTIENAAEEEYLVDGGTVLIATACLKSVDANFSEDLAQRVFNDEIVYEKGIEVIVIEADGEDFEASRKEDASIGKYKVFEMAEGENDKTLDDVCKMKASEIIENELLENGKTRVISNRVEETEKENDAAKAEPEPLVESHDDLDQSETPVETERTAANKKTKANLSLNKAKEEPKTDEPEVGLDSKLKKPVEVADTASVGSEQIRSGPMVEYHKEHSEMEGQGKTKKIAAHYRPNDVDSKIGEETPEGDKHKGEPRVKPKEPSGNNRFKQKTEKIDKAPQVATAIKKDPERIESGPSGEPKGDKEKQERKGGGDGRKESEKQGGPPEGHEKRDDLEKIKKQEKKVT